MISPAPSVPLLRRLPRGRLFLLLSCLLASTAHASLQVYVQDTGGRALVDAVVYAEPIDGPVPKAARGAEIEQKEKRFLPAVTVVQAGTSISFPNRDTVRHHVYSLSPAKVFDLKLYAGDPPNPVTFDKPGTVVIGCNIHDQMAAWIHVVSTPHFGKTDSTGKVRIEGMPSGRYRLKAWHPGLPPGAPPAEQVFNHTGGEASASITLNARMR
ncbi:MAG TPA: methylamine utilization protein [Noviherbaspirillum sp.]|jgi:plastocyanin|uniref:methylamine utilization protein n=1 Tax=Noviherbaspirillum sp. TaxID=1926288 RepID=UPI002F958F3C